ncbi:MAG: hypothetical protein K2X48_14520 [Chitinophagaceae bacterium]|nr:hypothetical protein [Chitinophagaceae bacterium]
MNCKTLFLLSFFFLAVLSSFAQDDPGAYMNLVNKAEDEANQKYLLYVSTAAHSGRIKKIEKMRQQAIDGIISSRNKSIGLPLYKGDNSLRQASIDYLNFLYLIFAEEYAKIVNMEDIAEQSFNEMQAFLLLQQKTSEKLEEATAKRNKAQKDFALKYNVRLIDDKTEGESKSKKASRVLEYRNAIYLIFFKCNWQYGELNKALDSKKVNTAEQARMALISYAKEGMAALDTLKNFDGDPSLANACRHALNQYKRIAEIDVPKMTDFYLKEENFQKVKRSFDSKPQNNRTQEDVNAYNKAVNEMNAAVNVFNSTSQQANKTANEVGEGYNKADKEFGDKHTPYFKK